MELQVLICFHRKGFVVNEVNSSPGLEGIEKATGVDIAGKIIEYVERNEVIKISMRKYARIIHMEISIPSHFADYELIDCGNFEKLERFGEYITIRPEPQAVWD